jgi:hypothetical protein
VLEKTTVTTDKEPMENGANGEWSFEVQSGLVF